MPVGRLARRLAALVIVLLAFGAGISMVGLLMFRRSVEAPYRGFAGEETVVTIFPGTSVNEGIDQLVQAGVLERALPARLVWRYRLDNPMLKAGEYRFRGPTSTIAVLEKISAGDVLAHEVTILEGLTRQEIAAHLADKGFGEFDVFVAEMSSPERISSLDPLATDLEGYLFPDTYSFVRGAGEARIVDTLVGTFRKRFAETEPQESELGLTPREIVILASIVEKEALADRERPTIAGVYANRLKRGMGLYADPTIIYALKLEGRWDGNLRRPDLEMDSPYNTYRVQGLPPGPICSPGLASLKAAAAPADVPYLYFVSRNDGTHVFAATLAEHNRNVYEWQKLYWQRRWAEKPK